MFAILCWQAKVDKLKEAAAKLSSTSFITGLEYSVQRKKVMTISTGAKQLDELIGGTVSLANKLVPTTIYQLTLYPTKMV